MLVEAGRERKWSLLKKTSITNPGIEVRSDRDWRVKVELEKRRWSPLKKTSIARHGIEVRCDGEK